MNTKTINLTLNLFASYRSCVNELDALYEARERFIYSLPGTTPKGISFEEFAGGNNNKYLLSKVSDEIEEWDRNHKLIYEFCNNVVNTCNKWISNMSNENKNIFTMRYVNGFTVDEVASSVRYTQGAVSKKIRNECLRITNIKEE